LNLTSKPYRPDTASVYRGPVSRDGLRDSEPHRKSIYRSWTDKLARRCLPLRALLQESRNFVARIRIVRIRQPYLVRFGPAMEVLPTGHLAPCKRTHACMRDRENFFASRPWATPLDVEAFVLAWNMGAEWRAGISDSCSPDTLDTQPRNLPTPRSLAPGSLFVK